MTRLKTDTLAHHISYIKHDLKRILILLVVPIILSLIFLPLFFLLLSSFVIPQSPLWTILSILLAFGISLFIQVFSRQKPDYKPDLKASIIFTIYMVIVNALIEEFFFRGFLLNLFHLIFKSSIIAALVSSAIFGYYHIPLFGWDKKKAIFAFLGGLFFAFIYYKTGSLVTVWFAHAAADLGLVHEGLVGYFVWTKLRHKDIS